MKIKIFFLSFFILIAGMFFISSDKAYAQKANPQACTQCPAGFDAFLSCPTRFGDVPQDEVCCNRIGIWPFIDYEYSSLISCSEAQTLVNGPCGSVTNASCKTAVGTINVTSSEIITTIFRLFLSIAGSIAVFLIIASGYRLMTSRGNPEQVQAARDQLTSAIIGLLFLIFSLVILQFIGLDLLGLPGFNP